ncbi:hypothetical protein CDL15_Pgr016878 [Punica granatum]|uniref:Uncharacterized protein n=1 Tax=Punica granatum TaxID=22663 RepID=A0A218WZ23_PUNGR|nr:hypothetical protein CDL15_Pgr016878 [Punica granatum]
MEFIEVKRPFLTRIRSKNSWLFPLGNSHPNSNNRPCWKLSRPDWAVFGSDVTTVDPDGILMQDQWLPTLKGPPEVVVVVVWFQTYRVDPYSPAKIMENRVRLENRPDWAVFESDVTMVSPNGVLRQG